MSPEEWLASQTKPTTPVLSPEEWEAQTKPGTVPSVVEQEKTNPQYQFDPRVAQLSGLTGAVLGATPLGRVGNLTTSVIKGAIGGGLGGYVGEAIRADSNDPNSIAALGAELAVGAAPSLVGEVVGRLAPAALGATFGYQRGKAAQLAFGRSESDIAAREASFGRQAMREGVAGTLYQDGVKDKWATELLNNYKITVPAGKKASDALRETVYGTLTKQGNLRDAPEFVDLKSRMKEGIRVGAIKSSDYKALLGLLESQVSKDPKFSSEFAERLINTMQQATPEWNGVKISDSAAGLMRETLDGYLARNNAPTYSLLKNVEAEEFVGKAVDSIPVVLNQNFRGKAMDMAMQNIHKSPEGQKKFRLALSTYFKNLEPRQVLKEWNRLEGDLVKFKTLPFEEIQAIKRNVKQFGKRTETGQQVTDAALNALKQGIARGVIPAEFANFAVEEETKDVPALL